MLLNTIDGDFCFMKKETLKEYAYYYIKEKIINCDYQPGTILNEELLKDEVNASRTPIRDAISRLEQENLVRILPKKGIIVSELSIREINSIYEARLLLEPYVIQMYGNRVQEEKYVQFLKFFSIAKIEDLDEKLMYEKDNELHHTFIAASENDYLISAYDRIHSQNRRLRILSGVKSESRLLETQEEHKRIVECCMARDWEGAAKRMKKHLVSSRKASFDAIFQMDDLSI